MSSAKRSKARRKIASQKSHQLDAAISRHQRRQAEKFRAFLGLQAPNKELAERAIAQLMRRGAA